MIQLHFLRVLPLGTAAICLLLPSCTQKNGFEKADADQSGSVSPDEFHDYVLDALYADTDANHDGKVTFIEWKSRQAAANEERFLAPDLNKDQAVSRVEADAFLESKGALREAFSKIDTNQDLQISKAEAEAFRTAAGSGSPSEALFPFLKASN